MKVGQNKVSSRLATMAMRRRTVLASTALIVVIVAVAIATFTFLRETEPKKGPFWHEENTVIYTLQKIAELEEEEKKARSVDDDSDGIGEYLPLGALFEKYRSIFDGAHWNVNHGSLETHLYTLTLSLPEAQAAKESYYCVIAQPKQGVLITTGQARVFVMNQLQKVYYVRLRGDRSSPRFSLVDLYVGLPLEGALRVDDLVEIEPPK
jgi:hypothetical protein